jgi:transcriptional regulator with XRE-family HTH domain
VTTQSDLRDFLTSRRARVTPEQAGLPDYGGRRRVAGLRREEVALLAGISVEYYTRLERGSAKGVSEGVLDGVARALQLDEAEHAHLTDLVRAIGSTGPARRRPSVERVRPAVQRVLDALSAPAYVRNGRLDILATNQLGAALYAPVLEDPVRPPNTARFLFLNPRATEFFVDWDQTASDAVAILRSEAGRDPYERRLTDLVGELSTRSHEFRVRWAAHDVKFHRTGVKRVHHPLVGDLTLGYEALELAADEGQRLNVYTAEPGTPSDEALQLLASWVSTPAGGRAADDRSTSP